MSEPTRDDTTDLKAVHPRRRRRRKKKQARASSDATARLPLMSLRQRLARLAQSQTKGS